MEWGVEEEFSIDLGNTFLVCATQISNYNYLACSSRETFIFSKGKIHNILDYVYSTVFYCEDLDLVFGVTAGIPSLEVFRPSAPRTMLASCNVRQSLVHQVFVSTMTRSVITVGSDIKVWQYAFNSRASIFELTQRAVMPSSTFCRGMNKVYFD